MTKKVAEALKKLFNQDRKKYETIWGSINLVIKYGCISNTKFDELMREYVIFKDSNDKWTTLKEYEESVPEQLQHKNGGQNSLF